MTNNIAILCHSENPPLRKLTGFLQELGWKPVPIRTPFGEELPPIDQVSGLIILGAAASVYEFTEYRWLENEINWVQSAINKNLPILGICFGCQMLAWLHGGKVIAGDKGLLFGFSESTLEVTDDYIFGNELNGATIFQAQKDTYTLPAPHQRLMSGTNYTQQAAKFAENIYGVQFHPEITVDMIFRWHRNITMRGIELADNVSLQELEKKADKYLPQTHIWLKNFTERLFKRAPNL